MDVQSLRTFARSIACALALGVLAACSPPPSMVETPYGACTTVCGDGGYLSCLPAGRMTDPAGPMVRHCTRECVSDGDCPLGARGAICLLGPFAEHCYQRCGNDLPACPSGTRCTSLLNPVATFCEPYNGPNPGG